MRVDFKPNEQVVKAGDATMLLNDQKVDVKLIVTNQNRLYVVNSDQTNNIVISKPNLIEIIYFDRNILFKDGVNIICKDNNFRFLVKKRRDWELIFANLY